MLGGGKIFSAHFLFFNSFYNPGQTSILIVVFWKTLTFMEVKSSPAQKGRRTGGDGPTPTPVYYIPNHNLEDESPSSSDEEDEEDDSSSDDSSSDDSEESPPRAPTRAPQKVRFGKPPRSDF
jgi:hypothetical protein